MATNKNEIIVAVVIAVIFSVVIVILIILTILNYSDYQICRTTQSPYCLEFGCQESGKLCGYSAIRYSEDGKNYYCSSAPEAAFEVDK
jgi:hypothetical protein